jgi:transmembrane sensor
MSDSSTPVRKTPPPPQVIAEAGVWVARLNGPNCEPARKGLRRWLAESKTHQQAFELATDVWEEAGALRGCAAAHLTRVKPPGRKAAYAGAMAVAAAVLVIGAVLYLNQTGVTTGVGELRQLTLEDGSRVLLNTSTHIVVKYDQYARRIELENGEALFDVMKNPRRPFVVTAGGREVTALGTSFNVRRDGPQVTVTLLEG